MNDPNWIRVSRRNRCPICHKLDWCLISADGKSAICGRIESIRRIGDAGYLHKLEGSDPITVRPTLPIKQSVKASAEAINRVYHCLLGNSILLERHRENLQMRGLTIPQIETLDYKSLLLEDRDSIIRRLQASGLELSGVPGFWRDDLGKWRLAGQPGLLIPVRNLQKQIVGFQIRCDDSSTGKYKWLSSGSKANGTSSGSSVHVAMPDNSDRSEIWVTEGPLKADISSLKLNRVVLAIPGVGCWSKAIPIIWELKPAGVVVALDMDKLTNPAVDLYRDLLIDRLLRMNLKVYEANWNTEYKGLDDLLANGVVK